MRTIVYGNGKSRQKWNVSEKLDDVVWPKTKKLINDYKKFLTYEKEKCKMILIKLTKTE